VHPLESVRRRRHCSPPPRDPWRRLFLGIGEVLLTSLLLESLLSSSSAKAAAGAGRCVSSKDNGWKRGPARRGRWGLGWFLKEEEGARRVCCQKASMQRGGISASGFGSPECPAAHNRAWWEKKVFTVPSEAWLTTFGHRPRVDLNSEYSARTTFYRSFLGNAPTTYVVGATGPSRVGVSVVRG
jgi:hypothetical protein